LIRQFFIVGVLFLPLFSSCNFSRQEIPEPDYNPYMLAEGRYVEAEHKIISRDTLAPPDTIRVKGQWRTAVNEVAEPKEAKSQSLPPKEITAKPVTVEMSNFDQPIIVESQAVRYDISLAAGIPAQGSIDGTGRQYLKLLSQHHGLSSYWVSSLFQDRFGRIWIGTKSGISIWDGSTLLNLTETENFPAGHVRDILEDSDQNIWLAIRGFGVMVSNGSEFTAYTTDQGLPDNRVTSLLEDAEGNIWIGTREGLCVIGKDGLRNYTTDQGLTNNDINDLTPDQNGQIWIGTWGGGINIWNGSAFSRLTKQQGLPDDYITKVYADSHNDIWIGTAGAGLVKWNHEQVQLFTEDQGPPAIAYPLELMEDSNGHIWIGTNFGVYVYDGEKIYTRVKDGLKFTVVWSMLQDTSGQIWIGTTRGGIHLITEPQAVHIPTSEDVWYYSGFQDILEGSKGDIWVSSSKLTMVQGNNAQPALRLDLSTSYKDLGASFLQDSYQNLVIGSMGVKLLDVNRIQEHEVPYLFFKIDTTVCAEIIEVYTMLEDQNKNLWLGAGKNGGLLYWDRSDSPLTDTATFLHYKEEQGLGTFFVNSLLEDKEGTLWVGTFSGLLSINDETITYYNKGALGVNAMALDGEGKLWVASYTRGLGIFDGKGFTWFGGEQGLPTNSIRAIHIDQQDRVWLGTETGLLRVWEESDGRVHYRALNEYHGVDPGVVSKVTVDRQNRLWAISQWNMDRVDLNQSVPDSVRPKLVLLQVQPFFDQFDWRQAKRAISTGEVVFTGDQEIPLSKIEFDSVYRFSNLPVEPEFPYNINHLTFQWSCTYWEDPSSIQYSYMLEGKDQAWSPLIRENGVTFNGLPAGNYTLKVRAVAGNALWSDTSSYSFTIMPPLWATWWAYGFYGLCALCLVLVWRHYEKKRFVLKQKAKALEEIDRTKSEFFTNISHELRTPLTLILGPLKALQQRTYQGDKDSLYQMMSQNGKRLLQLVNQLLDLSKLDQGKLELELRNTHLNELVAQTAANFDSACSLKNIELELYQDQPIHCKVDGDKIRDVLSNMISNAVKFTPEGGFIKVSVERAGPSSSASRAGNQTNGIKSSQLLSKEHIKIVVRDSGIGIAEEDLDQIFNRFYQVKGTEYQDSTGTGVGLALVQKIVELHQGTIEVESEPGWGATFTVKLPLIPIEHSEKAQPSHDENHTHTPTQTLTQFTPTQSTPTHTHTPTHTQFTLLLVEDNAQMRDFIKSCLGDRYRYLEAGNGFDGLKLAEQEIPDLIISDVMMPKMDGYEFCRRVQQQTITAHIPFVFLTAKADSKSQIKGLETGSNDYLIKPFDANELQLKIENLLQRISKLKLHYEKQLGFQGDLDAVESMDQRFLKQAIGIVEKQLSNHEFNVSEFAVQVGMSQTQLYRKLMALTGQAPSAFIRGIRLKKAAHLIQKNYGNTSDVAYAVGFNNLSYFAKCFKEQYGVSPSDYQKSNANRVRE